MKKYFTATSVRLCRFLYSIGFDKESFINDNGDENWRFEYSDDLQECLDFYFRKRNEIGVNRNGKRENMRNIQDRE